jgi:hypothetical protein
MSVYKELRKRPYYSLSAQKLANSFPDWSLARSDKHSNFQTIMSDMSEQLDMFSFLVHNNYNSQFHPEQDVTLPAYYYKYSDDGSVFFTTGAGSFNLPPVTVTGKLGATTYELTPCSYGDILDLSNRQFLTFEESIHREPRVSVLEAINANGSNPYIGFFDNVKSKSEFIIFVKEPIYLGFALVPKDETLAIVKEDFFAKRKNSAGRSAYIFGNAILTEYQTTNNVSVINMLPKYEHSFEGVIVPGMYVLKFDLLLESQLDNFYVQLVINNSFPSSRKKTLYSRNYTIENANKTAYMCIEDDYLIVQSIDYVEETTDFVLDSYLLFDDNNETVYPSSFLKKDVIMYALENPSDLEEPSKLHMYDLFLHGAHSIYNDNTTYAMNVVCDKIDYRPGDEIYLESRPVEFLYGNKLRKFVMEVENIESGLKNYIGADGNFFTEEDPWDPGPVRAFDLKNQEVRWKYTLPTDVVGTFVFTVFDVDTRLIIGKKIINVDYKIPYKTFVLDANYTGYELGFNPDQELEVTKSINEIKHLSFMKDGWIYDATSNAIYTNVEFDELVTGY